ncbi:MAG: hypothetical protein NUW37_13765 [Planctomycetes bacterium]|nr:hypothetical protein [Planctomycetota bacterium]
MKRILIPVLFATLLFGGVLVILDGKSEVGSLKSEGEMEEADSGVRTSPSAQDGGTDVSSVDSGSADVPSAQDGGTDVPSVDSGSADVPSAQDGGTDVPSVDSGSADVPSAQESSAADSIEALILGARNSAAPVRGANGLHAGSGGGRQDDEGLPTRDADHPGAPREWVRDENGNLMAMYTDEERAVLDAEAEKVAERRGTIVGALEIVDVESGIRGYAYDAMDAQIVLNVELYIDGLLQAVAPAAAQRGEIADTEVDPNALALNQRGFEFGAELLQTLAGEHTIRAIAKSSDGAPVELAGSPHVFGGNRLPEGGALEVSTMYAFGYAIDPDTPEKPVYVECIVDGTHYGFEIASKTRTDVPYREMGSSIDGNPGMQTVFPENKYAQDKEEAEGHYFLFAFDPMISSRARIQIIFFDTSSDKMFAECMFSPFVADGPGFGVLQGPDTPDEQRQVDEDAFEAEVEDQSVNQLPYGSVSFKATDRISGWALDPDKGDEPIYVDIYFDGKYHERQLADKLFAALTHDPNITSPYHLWIAEIPAALQDGQTHTLSVFAVNDPAGANPELPGSPVEFKSFVNSDPTGFVDGVDHHHIGGWAYDPDAKEAPIMIEVWIDDKLYRTVEASGDRQDLVPVVCPEPAHGWGIEAPEFIRDGDFHSVRVFAVNFPDGPPRELHHSPWELGALKPYLGVGVESSPGEGLHVTEVAEDSPAYFRKTSSAVIDEEVHSVMIEMDENLYLKAGDKILSYNETSAGDASAFVSFVQTRTPGEVITMEVVRTYYLLETLIDDVATQAERDEIQMFKDEPLLAGEDSAARIFQLESGWQVEVSKLGNGVTYVNAQKKETLTVQVIVGERVENR